MTKNDLFLIATGFLIGLVVHSRIKQAIMEAKNFRQQQKEETPENKKQSLRHQLELALEEQRYEDAAAIRDILKHETK